MRQAGLEQALAAGGAAVGVGVDDQLGAAGAAPRRWPSPCRRGSRPASAPPRAPRRRRRRRRRSAAARRGCRRAALSGRGGGGRRGRRSGRGGRGRRPGSAGSRRCRSAGRSPGARGRRCSRRTRPAPRRSARAAPRSCALQLGRAEHAPAQHLLVADRAPCRRRSVTRSPSLSSSKRPAPGASTRRIPARASISGPAFGYLPSEEGEALSTAATPASISSSAAIRSMLTWSMTATSPGRRRLTRCLVRSPEPGRAFDRRFRAHAVATPEQSGKATATGGGHAQVSDGVKGAQMGAEVPRRDSRCARRLRPTEFGPGCLMAVLADCDRYDAQEVRGPWKRRRMSVSSRTNVTAPMGRRITLSIL